MLPLFHCFSLRVYTCVLSIWSALMCHPPHNHCKDRINSLPISLKARSLNITISISAISSVKLPTSHLLFLPLTGSGAILEWPIYIKPEQNRFFILFKQALFYLNISVCSFIDEKTQRGAGFVFRKALCASECPGFTLLTWQLCAMEVETTNNCKYNPFLLA